MRSVVALVACLLAAVPHHAWGQADDYPSRTVTFMCPFPAGGGTDILTRMLAQELQDKLKRPFIVENRPGAGTQIAASAVAKSPPDGYMLLLAPVTTLAIGPSVYKALPYDTQKDFAPIGLAGSAQFALVANPSLGAATLPELIALIRSKSGHMSYGTSGASTPHHLFMEMFLKMIDAKAQHVPYRGSVPALTDVMSGQIPMMMVDLAVAMQMIAEGKVKAYGVTSATRIKAMPDLPTIACRAMRRPGGFPWWRGPERPARSSTRSTTSSRPFCAVPIRRTSCGRSPSSRSPARPTTWKNSFHPRSRNGHRSSRTPGSRRNDAGCLLRFSVVPAQAGTYNHRCSWVPAFAGTTATR